MKRRTKGISSKLTAPAQTALGALAYNWITTGVFDRASAGLLAVAVIGFVFGFLSPADEVREVPA